MLCKLPCEISYNGINLCNELYIETVRMAGPRSGDGGNGHATNSVVCHYAKCDLILECER